MGGLMLAVFMASVLELKDMKARKADGLAFNEYANDKLPGDLRFDPLRITRDLPREQKVEVLEKELLNGRRAMIAVSATWRRRCSSACRSCASRRTSSSRSSSRTTSAPSWTPPSPPRRWMGPSTASPTEDASAADSRVARFSEVDSVVSR